jgi:hypothetical protein
MKVYGRLNVPGSLPPRKNSVCTEQGLVFPRTDMNIFDERKISCLCWNSNSWSPNLKPCRYTDYAMPAPIKRRHYLD